MTTRSEAELRDYLAEHLEVIEPGLRLLDPEFHLPNSLGAKGFVDLLARDEHGLLVLIELKRSEAAARQAVQELHKYVALMAMNHGIGPADLRCLIVSTSWRELFVPFSELVNLADYPVTGRRLHLDAEGWPLRTEEVQPRQRLGGTQVCPKQQLFAYRRAAERDQAVGRLAGKLSSWDVKDFVIVCQDYTSEAPPPPFPHIAYVALATFDGLMRDVVEQNPEVDTIDEPEADEWDHEEAILAALDGAAAADSVEIGYPDRFASESESWAAAVAVRSGVFSSPLTWPEDTLMQAISGRASGHSVAFRERARPSHRARWAKFRATLGIFLLGASDWQRYVELILNEVEAVWPGSEVSVTAYSSCDVIWTLYGIATGEPGYVPTMRIVVTNGKRIDRSYIGTLCWNGFTRPESVDSTVSMYFEGGMGEYLMSRHLHEQWRDDHALSSMHGLRLGLFLVSSEDPLDRREMVIVNDVLQTRPTTGSPFLSVIDFAMANPGYMASLRGAIEAHQIAPGMYAF